MCNIIVVQEVYSDMRQHEKCCEYKFDLWDQYENDEPILEDEMILWIKENTKGKAYCGGDFVFKFELEEDAMAFKLRWM